MTGERETPRNDVNHAAFDHETLKQWTDDVDLQASQGFADEWVATGNSLQESAQTLKRAMMDSESGWSGEAAEAMRVRLGLVAIWSAGTGAQLTAAGEAVGDQNSAAETARNSMPEPVPYNPGQMVKDAQRGGLLEMVMLPQTLHTQKEQHDAAHEEAVRVVSERDTAMNSVAGNVVSFGPPPVLNQSTDGDTIDSEDFDGGPSSGGPESGGPRGGGPEVAGWPGPGSREPSGFEPSSAPDSGSSAGPGSPAVTSPGSYTPREPGLPPVVTGPGVGAGPSSGGAGFGPTGGLLPGGGYGVGGGAGGGRGSGAGGSGGGRGPGGAAPGPGSGSGRGTPGTIGGPAEAARGAAGTRGPGGMGGMPMGAGRGKGDEDAERQRPEYLLEPDPDSAFDTDQLTAPPVIGGPDDE